MPPTVAQTQYDQAKDIILDLLGWGVPPEYLVRCGLSREMVYYAFLDFNLRLPDNFDITGLPTPQDLAAIATTVANRRNRLVSQSPSHRHPLPQVSPIATSVPPLAEDITPSTAILSAVAPPFVPADATTEASLSLQDMEQDRRRMLLARKAVQASRKRKPSAEPDHTDALYAQSPVLGPVKAVERAASVVPAIAVDDFLNSIGPAKEPSREGHNVPIAPADGVDDMDVDGPPGLSGYPIYVQRVESAVQSHSSHTASTSGNVSTSSSVPSTTIHRSPSPLRRTDTEKVVPSDPASGTNSSVGSGSGSGSGLSTPVVNLTRAAAPVRRVTKRPVAADFVDMEPGPSRANGNNHMVAPVAAHHVHHHSRRKIASFAVVSSKHRRMVIDITDSEDEGSEDEESSTRQRADSIPSRTTAAPPTIAQAELADREREIHRLRAQIAKKELEARLKREAAVRLSTLVFREVLSSIFSPVGIRKRHSEYQCSIVVYLRFCRCEARRRRDGSFHCLARRSQWSDHR